MKFRKKPVEIEAVQFNGTNHREVCEFITTSVDHEHYDGEGFAFDPTDPSSDPANGKGTTTIRTLEGDMTATAGDWIIRGVQGEFYPCKPDIFDATYEAV
jgi:hypothetical protein